MNRRTESKLKKSKRETLMTNGKKQRNFKNSCKNYMMNSEDIDMLNEWNKPFANRKYPRFLAKERLYNPKKNKEI